LRAYCIANSVRAGNSIKTVQTLARPTKASLTLDRYARADLHKVYGVVEPLPNLPSPGKPTEFQRLNMTGTDEFAARSAFRVPEPKAVESANYGTEGQPISKVFADYLPHTGNALGRELPDFDAFAPSCGFMSPPADGTEVIGSDGLGRELSDADASKAERTGRQLNFLLPAS
jgi:hypothetical protein